MSDLTYTPVEVEQRLRRLMNELSQAVRMNDEAYGRYLVAKRELDQATAAAYVDTLGKGSIPDREALTELAVSEQRTACDVADQAYRYAKNRLDMLKIQIMGVQSIGRSAAVAYQATGVVEP